MNKNGIFKIEPLGFQWATQDPFIFCVHHRDEYPKGNDEMGPDVSLEGRRIGQDFTLKDGWRMYHGQSIPGFPVHPHRGFETVTIVKEGLVDHSDSLGGAGRFGKNDVQWMTAGKGIQHSEMFPLISKDKENPMELFQIWLNLPASSKFVEPHYKMLWAEDIPVLEEKDNQGKSIEISIIAGELKGLKAPGPTPDSWASNPANQLGIMTVKLEAGASWILSAINPETNRTLYFYKGQELFVNGEKVDSYHSIRVYPDEDILLQAGLDDCFILILQGQPIDEPLVQYGPFVMNSDEEIEEAFRDYRQTQFGGWPWPSKEPAHGREKGRFAIHPDGRKEFK